MSTKYIGCAGLWAAQLSKMQEVEWVPREGKPPPMEVAQDQRREAGIPRRMRGNWPMEEMLGEGCSKQPEQQVLSP